MKTGTMLFVGTLVSVLAAGPGLAQTTSNPKESSNMSAPAEKPSKLSMPHSVTGAVVASDASASMLTVKDSKGKEYTFKADSDAAGRLGALKAGDKVKVAYRKSKGEMVATKITETK